MCTWLQSRVILQRLMGTLEQNCDKNVQLFRVTKHLSCMRVV